MRKFKDSQEFAHSVKRQAYKRLLADLHRVREGIKSR